jgi:hypothetical protein
LSLHTKDQIGFVLSDLDVSRVKNIAKTPLERFIPMVCRRLLVNDPLTDYHRSRLRLTSGLAGIRLESCRWPRARGLRSDKVLVLIAELVKRHLEDTAVTRSADRDDSVAHTYVLGLYSTALPVSPDSGDTALGEYKRECNDEKERKQDVACHRVLLCRTTKANPAGMAPTQVDFIPKPDPIPARVQRLDTHHGLAGLERLQLQSQIAKSGSEGQHDAGSGANPPNPRRLMMRFYKQQHQFHCGVDLHAKTLHLCVLDQAGDIVRHRGIKARPKDFLRTIEP